MDKSAALGRVRVVDFTHMGVGPITTRFLADMGAEVVKVQPVIKVEPANRRGTVRGSVLPQGASDADASPSFASWNFNKLGINVNLKSQKGLELARCLIRLSDIVADSFTPGVMERLGLGYEELRKVKPDIIQISMSYAGSTGPYREHRGHGQMLQALVGLPHLTGYPERPPMAPGIAYTDFYCPGVWVVAVMGALAYRGRTGKGQFIDGSDFEAAVDLVDTALLDWQTNKRIQTRRGNRHPTAAPHNIYPCKGNERWVAIAVLDDEEWAAFGAALGNPDWTQNPRFATAQGRKEHEGELDQRVSAWTSCLVADDVMQKLQAAGVRTGAVQDTSDLWSDPQLSHREHFWLREDPRWRRFTYEPAPYRLSKTPARFYRPAPGVGRDSDWAFTRLLGLSDEQFAEAVGEGAIA